jgi:hypothetical protein
LEGVVVLDALSDHERSGLPGEGGHRQEHRASAWLSPSGADNAAIELDELGVELAQHLKSGVARPDVVNSDLEAMFAQALQTLDYRCGAAAEALSDLDHDLARREPCLFHSKAKPFIALGVEVEG